MLQEETLLGKINKVELAIKRLKAFEPKEGYFLAFSGGKDSQCIYHLAKMARVKFDAHFFITSVDPPELIKFVRNYYSDVIFHNPKISMRNLILKKGILPTRRVRFCCEYLKENNDVSNGRVVLLGIRAEESPQRARQPMLNTCTKYKQKKLFRPILYWGEEDVWEFLNLNNIPHCSLYDEGFSRIGCVMCPLSKNIKKEADRWPSFAKIYYSCCVELCKNGKSKFKNPEDLYKWWIGEIETQKDTEGQIVMFE